MQSKNMQNRQQSNFEQAPSSIGGEYRVSTEKQEAQYCWLEEMQRRRFSRVQAHNSGTGGTRFHLK